MSALPPKLRGLMFAKQEAIEEAGGPEPTFEQLVKMCMDDYVRTLQTEKNRVIFQTLGPRPVKPKQTRNRPRRSCGVLDALISALESGPKEARPAPGLRLATSNGVRV